jgi:hypothetical protein
LLSYQPELRVQPVLLALSLQQQQLGQQVRQVLLALSLQQRRASSLLLVLSLQQRLEQQAQ